MDDHPLAPVGDLIPDRRAAEVMRALRHLSAGIDRYRHAEAARLGLGLPGIVTLAALLIDEPLLARDVGERTGLSPGAVTALLDRLEQRGLLTRTRPDFDRRSTHIDLTDAGRDVARTMYQPVISPLEDAFATADGTEIDHLVQGLDRLAELLVALAADRKRGGTATDGISSTGQSS